jgi:hypothetical protein
MDASPYDYLADRVIAIAERGCTISVRAGEDGWYAEAVRQGTPEIKVGPFITERDAEVQCAIAILDEGYET